MAKLLTHFYLAELIEIMTNGAATCPIGRISDVRTDY